MPAYNAEEFISQSINSALTQTYQDIELIIINDNSTDNTEKIINHINDNRIVYIKNQRNLGASKSRNLGIKKATGRYISFLDSDDLWEKDKLKIQIEFLNTKNIPFTYSAYNKINKKNEIIDTIGIPDKLNREKLLKTCYIGCLTAIYDTQKIGKVFMPTNTLREDYATWLNIIRETKFLYGINLVLASYRVHEKQSSASKIKMAKENWLLYRIQEAEPIHKTLWIFTNYMARGILRNKFPKLSKLIGTTHTPYNH